MTSWHTGKLTHVTTHDTMEQTRKHTSNTHTHTYTHTRTFTNTQVVRAQSTEGLSLVSNIVELLCYTIIVAYNLNHVSVCEQRCD